jgi:hypothetical protein
MAIDSWSEGRPASGQDTRTRRSAAASSLPGWPHKHGEKRHASWLYRPTVRGMFLFTIDYSRSQKHDTFCNQPVR